MGKRVSVEEMEQLLTEVLRERIEAFTISKRYIKRLVETKFGDEVQITSQGVARAVRLVTEKGLLIPTDDGLTTNSIFAVDVRRVLEAKT